MNTPDSIFNLEHLLSTTNSTCIIWKEIFQKGNNLNEYPKPINIDNNLD